jgi:hypothetical protein
MGISAQDHAREIGNLLDKHRAEIERLRSELVLIRAMAEDAKRPDCMNVNEPITRILLACERALQKRQ